jgi:hypothetical protein
MSGMKKNISIGLINLLKASALIILGILPFSNAADIQGTHFRTDKRQAHNRNTPDAVRAAYARRTINSAHLWSVFYMLDDGAGNLYLVDGSRVRKVDAQGQVTTIAGNGCCGHSGDGGAAMNAAINPLSLAADALGNLYIGEPGAIRKVNKQGIISTIAGNGCMGNSRDGIVATAAGFGKVYGMAFDASGNLFFSDWDNGVVRKIDARGNISTAAALPQPYNLKFDAVGNLYIADARHRSICMMDTAGIVSAITDNGTQHSKVAGGYVAPGKVWGPTDFAFDSSGKLYVADDSNLVAREVTRVDALNLTQAPETSKAIFLFPDASNGCFTLYAALHLKTGTTTPIQITNMLGQVVYENTIALRNGNIYTHIIPGTGLPNGIYLLHINSKNEPSTVRFVLQE